MNAQKKNFSLVKKSSDRYGSQLRKIAKHIADLIKEFKPDDTEIQRTLYHYSHVLQPWAERAAYTMLKDVARRDADIWHEMSKGMSRALRKEIETAPTGRLYQSIMREQVKLITSLPVEAGERVRTLVQQAQTGGKRWDEVAEEIANSYDVTMARANTIARTEVATASSALTQARAMHIGSEGYLWRTAQDNKVRKAHKQMQGKFVRWDKPPTLSDGTVTHAGQIYNCRCYTEPVIPDIIR